MFKKILLAYDGSDHAMRAYDMAVALALKLTASLEIVQVETRPDASNWIARLDSGPEAEMAKTTAQVLAPLWRQARSRGDARVSGDILHGEPAHEIAKYAEENEIDLVVMGRRGRGRVEGLLLGSVSSHLTSHANCAVLTVK